MNTLTIENLPDMSYASREAINTLCTNLSFAGENIRKIMLTSCHESEGKSTLAMNITQTMVRLGKTVALVDADLRRSVMNTRHGIRFGSEENKAGLSHMLAGMATEDEIIYSTNVNGVLMVPVGREVVNSLPLLVSPKFRQLLDRLARMVDYVIVDAPPLGAIIDAAEIGKSCDGTLLVVSYNTVRKQHLIEVKEQLEQTGCPILGTVLNRVSYRDYLSKKYYYKSYGYKSYGYKSYGYGYGYGYGYYGHDRDRDKSSKRKKKRSSSDASASSLKTTVK